MCTAALQRPFSDINQRVADMWSYAVLLWELATREVPFAELSPMEVGMKVRFNYYRTEIMVIRIHCGYNALTFC